MLTRGKFVCIGKANNNGSLEVGFEPVTAGSEENNHFSELTPYGALTLGGVKQEIFDAIQMHSEYYVDITAVPKEVKPSE